MVHPSAQGTEQSFRIEIVALQIGQQCDFLKGGRLGPADDRKVIDLRGVGTVLLGIKIRPDSAHTHVGDASFRFYPFRFQVVEELIGTGVGAEFVAESLCPRFEVDGIRSDNLTVGDIFSREVIQVVSGSGLARPGIYPVPHPGSRREHRCRTDRGAHGTACRHLDFLNILVEAKPVSAAGIRAADVVVGPAVLFYRAIEVPSVTDDPSADFTYSSLLQHSGPLAEQEETRHRHRILRRDGRIATSDNIQVSIEHSVPDLSAVAQSCRISEIRPQRVDGGPGGDEFHVRCREHPRVRISGCDCVASDLHGQNGELRSFENIVLRNQPDIFLGPVLPPAAFPHRRGLLRGMAAA